MKRLAIGVLLAAGMAGVFFYTGVNRDAEYRRLIAAGDLALANEESFPAIEAFSGAIALRSDAMLGYLKRGETYRRRGDLAAALRDLARANALAPEATRPLEQLGDVAQDLGRYEEAAAHYTAYTALDDQSPRVLYKLALAHHRAQRASRAIPILRQALEMAPDQQEAHYLLGLGLADQGRLDEALDALRTAVRLRPGFITAREALSGVLARAGLDDEQLEQLEALAALEPDRPQRDVDLGLAYARAGRTDMAVLALGRATEEHPEQPQAYVALGRVWLDIALADDDRVALSKSIGALQSIPQATASSEALTLLARALLLSGAFEEAVATLEVAVTRFPVDPSAFSELADLVEHGGDPGRARQLLVAHAALTAGAPPDVRLPRLNRIADLALAQGDIADAIVRLEAVRSLGDPTPSLLARLAEAHHRVGDDDSARAVLADGLAAFPSDARLRFLQRLVR